MIAEFTPGPWEQGTKLSRQVYAEDAVLVATSNGYGQEEHISIANARLIAAAPDLYSALDVICSEFANAHPLIVEGKAALAKARGEA